MLSSKYLACLVCSITLNLLFIVDIYVGDQWKLSWTTRAALEAEKIAAIYCSGHGRAYLDGLVVADGNQPVCSCNTCFTGPDCSRFIPRCAANADGVSGNYMRPSGMRSLRNDLSFSVQVPPNSLALQVFALSPENTTSPARVVASVPYYAFGKVEFDGDAYTWRNTSDARCTNMIELVTSPNNPDGELKQAILHGPNVKPIYDRAYYWPHFTTIPAPADEDVVVLHFPSLPVTLAPDSGKKSQPLLNEFIFSSFGSHCRVVCRWAVILDETVFNRMITHMHVNSLGMSKDAQLRAFRLLKAVQEQGTEIFGFAYETMKSRWERLVRTVSSSDRFSLPENNPRYCTFHNKVRQLSPAYAWLKCESEEDEDCYAVLKAANIIGRRGNLFGAEDRYVRLSLIGTEDDFNMLLERLKELISKEDGDR
ncbi:Pyridoxal phosphate (PLP)-dependent transferases superfamily protein, putative isoform 2 [Hibiscus syriacus]|uniref:Pyridoxal phosphate (PLP)-dependent transferases superfamily protein, putative isoform 2 n=1 Tax=Hibiscus syriacus TaxID=106335 RepID=A0A6A3AC73_HIBSY|nr:Pyridoxal phosphate (PLP)-dependent transferases superfamily protein, putative isoform 2 [Hibiscus syriacus]